MCLFVFVATLLYLLSAVVVAVAVVVGVVTSHVWDVNRQLVPDFEGSKRLREERKSKCDFDRLSDVTCQH